MTRLIEESSQTEEVISYFNDKPFIQVDTETTGRDCHTDKIILLQLGDEDNQFVVDCRKTNILQFKKILEEKNLILQNSKFDYKMLKKVGITIEHIYDTMLAECVIYCGYPKWGYNLKDLHKRYLDIDLDKETRQTFSYLKDRELSPIQIKYAAKDVTNLGKIKDLQEVLIKEHGLRNCVSLENECVKAFADIEYNGMYLNKEMWTKNCKEDTIHLKELQSNLDNIVKNNDKLAKEFVSRQYNMFSDERELSINYASLLQMKIVCKLLGFNVISTNDKQLDKLVDKHPFFKELRSYRETAKRVSTYGYNFVNKIHPVTGRIHTDFWQVRSSGRVSSGNKKTGSLNLQNIPADNRTRNCFQSEEGYSWISEDFKSQEMMLMADFSNEEGFIDVLNKGGDIHCFAGSMMFGREIDPIKDKAIRTKVKTLNFSKAYGSGPDSIADKLKIPISEAKELFKLYEKTFPRLTKWLKESGESAKNNMHAATYAPCRRIRWFPKMRVVAREYASPNPDYSYISTISGEVEREGANHLVQGAGANVCKEAIIEVRNLIAKYNNKYGKDTVKLICQVHDSIDSECKDEYAKEFAKEKSDIMIAAGNKYVSKVKMETDIAITKHWQK